MNRIKEYLQHLYPDSCESLEKEIDSLIRKWKGGADISYPPVTEKDVILITYGDGIRREGEPPLVTLREFLKRELPGAVSAVHLLPMFPYTSDDGFSVVDYRQINPALGSWEDVECLHEYYELMFDAVINHVSSSSSYVKEYVSGNERYRDFFIEADPKEDYSAVIRPRTLPLLTKFETSMGVRYLWTTFSSDQIDLNYHSPQVLLEILDVLLFYASKGARFLRFDAIGFAWKENGTTCMHLPQTHELIQLMRCVLDSCFRGCIIITETNVPHEENISYFGDGYKEAGMVYQFPLPPLVLYSYLSGDASRLTDWAIGLSPAPGDSAYFNFLASHDGIGLRPVETILSSGERQFMVDEVLQRGGQIGYRSLADGRMAPYELNISYLDAIAGDEKDIGIMVRKFLSSQCILLSVMGVPGIYYHSLLGSRNCYKDFEESGMKRRINREKLDADELSKELSNPDSVRSKIRSGFQKMLAVRRREAAFSPVSLQKILKLDERIFSLVRGEDERILALINVSGQQVECRVEEKGKELLTDRRIDGSVVLEPYEYLWVKLGSND